MSTETNPTQDNTTPDIWQKVESLQNELAKYLREHDAGKEHDPLKIMQWARQEIGKSLATPVATPLDVSVRDLLASYWDQVTKRRNVASTGFKSLNTILGDGIEDSRLVVVLGAPNTGKTTFIHQIADHIADTGRPVLYVTSEDSPATLMSKTLARIGNINYSAVLKGWDTERAKINAALARQLDRKSSDRLRYLDASNGIDMEMIRDKAAAHFAHYSDETQGGGPGVLIVDYLQRIARAIKTKGASADLREVVTMVAEQLRAIACELHCGVIAIASQNRAGYARGSDTGAMATAKESGDIEYTCDVLMALGEDRDAKRMVPTGMTGVMLYVDKNRQGQRGKSIPLDFWPDRQQFTEAEQ